ncbi:MAG: hypothetical protein EXR98_00565 [Gemmataceae bacterium]|nr:hypothetical protein [Gemmataceae bacterium]
MNMTCHHCQQQLLPYLYDLLEPQERADFVAHLGSCPDCRRGLQAAQEQQGMLAEAVKEEHPEIVFKAPTKATPASTAPTVLMYRPARRLLFLNRWAAAAAILFVLFSVGMAAGFKAWRHSTDAFAANKNSLAKAKENLTKSQHDLKSKKGQTQQEIKAIQDQIDSLFNDWRTKETQTRKVIEDKRAESRINVYGPQVAQAGAPTKYEIERNVVGNNEQNQNIARGINQGKVQQQDSLPGTMSPSEARVVNTRTGETLYQQKLMYQANNRANFDLPVLPIKPGDDLVIEFHAVTPDGKLVVLRDNLKIVFPEYVTHLATDRPIYRPGETIRFRSLTLERFSLKPAQLPFHLRYRILGPKSDEIFRQEVASLVSAGPKNENLKGPDGADLHGLGVGDFKLPADLASGQYTLVVSEVNERFNEEKRSFLVQRWQPARFTKVLTFNRTSYGAGDQIKFQARIVSLQGGPQGIRVNARVVIDGQKVLDQPLTTDQDGKVAFECPVPVVLPRGVGKVSLECNDGGSPETLLRDIPLVVRDLQVEFYPEGGDLIARAPNRVYFQARTPANRPADFAGRIVDDKNQEVARVQSVSDPDEPGANQGLGYFTFVPAAAKKYKLIVDSPIGIERTVALPEVKNQGVVMTIPDGVVENQVEVLVQSTQQRRELLIGVYCRGRMIDHQFVRAGVNQPVQAILKPALGVGGVYRVTVFEIIRTQQEILHRPIAERLIYRKSSEKVDVEIKADRASYQPGDAVRLSLQARSEKKIFAPSVALVAVVDSSLLKHADEKTGRSMPTHFLLTTEVRNPEDLEYADFLLGDHPQASQALDLLLGCQGWRRFAEQDPQMFVRAQKQQKTPGFLANSINPVAQFVGTDQKDIEKLDQSFVKQAIDLQRKLGETEKQETAPNQQEQVLRANVADVDNETVKVSEAERQLRETRLYFIQFGLGGGMLTLLFIGFFLVSIGLRRLSDGEGKPRAWLFSGLSLLGFLFLASIIGTIAFMGDNLREEKNPPGFKMGMQLGNLNQPVLANVDLIELEDIFLPDDLEDPKNMPPQPVAPKKNGTPAANEINLIAQAQDQRNPNLIQALVPGGDAQKKMQDEMDDRRLRQDGEYQTLLLRNLGRRVQMPPVNDPSVVREYAHRREANKDDLGRDLADTIYWHPVLVMADGKAEVTFDLADSVTRYQVLVLSHTFDGRLGANRIEIAAKLPFMVDPKVPLEVSDKDQVTIPVTLQNDGPNATTATLLARAKGLEFADKAELAITLKPGQRTRELFDVKPTISDGIATLRIVGKTAGFGDAVERQFKVLPHGFPITGSVSGVIDGRPVEHTITLPEQWNAGTLRVQAHFYPSPLAEISGALETLLGEPGGPFEQTASTNFANLLILQYLQAAKQSNPIAEKQARQLLHAGHQRLLGYECLAPGRPGEKRGYAWFGPAGAPDEALTAYGLLQFRGLAKVQQVEDEMLERTEQFLLEHRDNKGGFQRNPKDLARATAAVNNAYILWALTESGVKDGLDRELAALREQGNTQKDPYFLALAALSHLNVKKTAEGIELLRALVTSQKPEGIVTGAKTSINGARGNDLDVETTSLAILGWIKAGPGGEFKLNIQAGVKWLNQQRRGVGAYGGAQATVLALKAMIAHYHRDPRPLQAGEVLMVPKRNLPNQGQANQFAPPPNDLTAVRGSVSPRAQDMVTLTVPHALQPGKNVIELNATGNNVMPYTLTWSYLAEKPPSDPKAPLKLTAKLSQGQAREGETVKLAAVLENISGKSQGMAVAILGLPGGLSLPDDTAPLNALVEKNAKISAWELRGRELVLYWRDLAPDAKIALDLDLVCRLPGLYHGPASRAYLAYDAEHKSWIAPLTVRVHPAK